MNTSVNNGNQEDGRQDVPEQRIDGNSLSMPNRELFQPTDNHTGEEPATRSWNFSNDLLQIASRNDENIQPGTVWLGEFINTLRSACTQYRRRCNQVGIRPGGQQAALSDSAKEILQDRSLEVSISERTHIEDKSRALQNGVLDGLTLEIKGESGIVLVRVDCFIRQGRNIDHVLIDSTGNGA